MKKLIAKLIFGILFLFPMSCFADMLCGHSYSDEVFKIVNVSQFPDYNFYFSAYEGDATVALEGKEFRYSTNHLEAIDIFARNLKTGVNTSRIKIEPSPKDKTVNITIEKIENDSIYFKTDLEENKSSSFNHPITPLTKLMIFISFCGLFIYCCKLVFGKQKLKTT